MLTVHSDEEENCDDSPRHDLRLAQRIIQVEKEQKAKQRRRKRSAWKTTTYYNKKE